MVNPKLEEFLSTLEFNFLLTKYNEMSNKDGDDVSIYAFFYGLCKAENIKWGYSEKVRSPSRYCYAPY